MASINTTTKIAVLLGFFIQGAFAFGQKLYTPRVPDALEKFQAVEFYLITAGIGSDLASRFGHTGIRIVDPNQGQGEARDVVYNWGKFSFNDPSFAWKFFRGSLVYSMGVRTFERDVSIYREVNRLLVMEPLVLTLLQKRDLYQRIATNSRPENREFQYQYWFKNCSTIPRDLIDAMTQGGVKAALGNESTPMVYRDYVIRNLSAIPFVVPGLDMMMNGNIDRPITKWDEMFLPEKLREHLRSLPAFDDQGKPVPGTKLLGESRILTNGPEQYQRPFDDYLLLVAPLWVLGGLFLLLKIMARHSTSLKILGIGLVYYGLLFGFFGFILVFNWIFSGHPDGWANKNLLFFWPTDFLFCWMGIHLVRQKTAIKNRRIFPRDLSVYVGFKILATLYFLLTLMFPQVPWLGSYQNMTSIFLWFGSVSLILLPIFMLVGLAYGPQRIRAPQATHPEATSPQSLVGSAKQRVDL